MAGGAEHAVGTGEPGGAGANAGADLLAGVGESAGADAAGEAADTTAANAVADTAANAAEKSGAATAADNAAADNAAADNAAADNAAADNAAADNAAADNAAADNAAADNAVADNAAATAAADNAAADNAAAAADHAAPAGADLTVMVEGAWVEIKAKVREFGPALPALLAAAAVARVEGDVIVLAHQHAALAQRLSEAKNLEAVRSTVRAVLGREFEVRWEVGGAASGGAGRGRGAGNAGRGAGAQAPAKKAPPKFSRPSQAKAAAAVEPQADTSGGWGASSSGSRDGDSSAGTPASPLDDDIPLPDGPDLPDDPGPSDYSPVGYDGVPPASTAEEEREMLADAAVPVPPGDRRDPDEMALELLRSELGASPLEA